MRPQMVYFAIEDEFDEVIQHINNAEKLFALDLKKFQCNIAEVSNGTFTSFLSYIHSLQRTSGHQNAS